MTKRSTLRENELKRTVRACEDYEREVISRLEGGNFWSAKSFKTKDTLTTHLKVIHRVDLDQYKEMNQ